MLWRNHLIKMNIMKKSRIKKIILLAIMAGTSSFCTGSSLPSQEFTECEIQDYKPETDEEEVITIFYEAQTWVAEVPLTYKMLKDYFRERQGISIRVIRCGQQLCGALVATKNKKTIHGIAIKKRCRRRGCATQLIEEAIQESKKWGNRTIGLRVHATNNAACNLYKKLGFYITDLDYYMLDMEKNLAEQ